MGRNVRSLMMAGSLGIATVAMFSGCSTGDRSSGQYIDDRMTSRRVKGTLNDNPIYKFEDVNVNTYRGVVQLSGWVTNPEQKQIAGNLAKNIEGVLDVVNNIAIKPQFQMLSPTGESQTGQPVSQERQTQQQREQEQQRQQQRQQNP
jgi:hyperosmotically inducible protein